ncbi:hypothetical protein [Enterovirga rhinocerotis]|nr:hypothetical protein [Enterovirga rhinocerotis]
MRLGRFEISIRAVIAIVAVVAILAWLVLFDETALGLLRSGQP